MAPKKSGGPVVKTLGIRLQNLRDLPKNLGRPGFVYGQMMVGSWIKIILPTHSSRAVS